MQAKNHDEIKDIVNKIEKSADDLQKMLMDIVLKSNGAFSFNEMMLMSEYQIKMIVDVINEDIRHKDSILTKQRI